MDALEVPPEGVYQDMRGRAVIDIVCPLQPLPAKGLPRLWPPGRSGGHGLLVLGRKDARRGSPP